MILLHVAITLWQTDPAGSQGETESWGRRSLGVRLRVTWLSNLLHSTGQSLQTQGTRGGTIAFKSEEGSGVLSDRKMRRGRGKERSLQSEAEACGQK